MTDSSGTRMAGTLRPRDVVYDAGRQSRKVRALLWLSVCVAAGAMWWGVDLARHYGLAPADGGALAPRATRLALGSGVALSGLAFAVGMWIYARQYIAQIRRAPAEDALVIRTLGLLRGRERRYAARDVRFGRTHEGRASVLSADSVLVHGIEVYAPWQSVRVPDRRLPLVLDRQGWFRRAARR